MAKARPVRIRMRKRQSGKQRVASLKNLKKARRMKGREKKISDSMMKIQPAKPPSPKNSKGLQQGGKKVRAKRVKGHRGRSKKVSYRPKQERLGHFERR